MIPRGKIYISYIEILTGIYYSICSFFKAERTIKKPNDNSIICLSARTGFDLVLRALDLPKGSEILVTAINIPGMFDIIRRHGLTAVPLPVNKHTLGLSASQIEAAITPSTKAILITHLFGAIMETGDLVTVAKKNNIVVIEDCAQAFAGNAYKGNPASDAVLFSFGFIKTNSALSGGSVHLNDPHLFNQVHLINEQYPRQVRSKYLKRLIKGLFIKMLTQQMFYTLFYNMILATGNDFDKILSSFTKGFPGDDILKYIRYRPSVANEKLIESKLRHFDEASLQPRITLAHDILTHIPERYKIGGLNKNHSFWILPIESKTPSDMIIYLRKHGFDATQKASSLIALANSQFNAPESLRLETLVYLPMYTNMSTKRRKRLSDLINGYSGL